MRTFARWSLIVIGTFFVLATLLPFIPTTAWWIRELEFPRVQIAMMATTVAILLAFFFRRDNRVIVPLAALLAGCAIYQAWMIFPYTPIASEESLPAAHNDSASRLTIMIANVEMYNRSTDPFLQTVRRNDPDILLMLEPDEWWKDRVAMLGAIYPHAIMEPLGNTYGIILYSRLPLIDGAVRYLVEDTIPSIFARVRLRSGELVDLYSLHPRPPIPESNSEQRDAELLMVAREVRRNNRPAIVMGDLNDVAWSRTTKGFQEISGMLDPRKGRGFYNSFHAEYFFLRYPLDHVFHTPHFRLINLARGPYIGSDHFPLTMSVTMP